MSVRSTWSWLFAVGLLAACGCGDRSLAERVRELGAEHVSADAVFDNAAELLNTLDQGCDTDFRYWPVVVDKTNSTDGQPITAVLQIVDVPGQLPGQPVGKATHLLVMSKNIDFLKHGIEPGDKVELYLPASAKSGESEYERQLLADFGRREAFGLSVRRVIDATTLEIDFPRPIELDQPQPIIIRRENNEKFQRAITQLEAWRRTGEPAIAWEPTPDLDAVDGLATRFNLWLEHQAESGPASAWQIDPLVERLGVAVDPQLAAAALAGRRFSREEARLLQEAVWLRDIARRALKVPGADPLQQAAAAFDWTIRHLQLESPQSLRGLPQRPWQALFAGWGTGEQRAWVFVLLARQLHLDAVLLAAPGDAAAPQALRPFCVAVRVGSAWHLFDPQLGLPLPGPGGTGIATLAQVQSDPAVLRQLDLPGGPTYAITAADAKAAVALVEATPLYYSRRAREVERQLAGERKVVLTANAKAIADALAGQVADVRLWNIAAATSQALSRLSQEQRNFLAARQLALVRVPVLYKGRVVQLKNNTRRWELDPLGARVQTYTRSQDPRVILTMDRCISTQEELRGLDELSRFAFYRARQSARMWLGQIAYEDGEYAVARDYFADLAPQAIPKQEQRPLTEELSLLPGAAYNLARTEEALARQLPAENTTAIIAHLDRARSLLANDTSPQSHGNQWRARQLTQEIKNRHPPTAPPEPD